MKSQSFAPPGTHIEEGTSLWKDAWARLKKNKLAVFGGVVIVSLTVVALITPWIVPYSYDAQDLVLGASPPSPEHLLGTDTLGRDLLTRILYGSRISLMVGFCATAVALFIGVIWGAVAGYFGGRLDDVMMRIVDILYSLPFIVFVIILMTIFGRNLILLFAAIGAVEWLTLARIVRGQILSLRKQEFVEACISQGLPTRQIIFRHLVPNVLGTIIIYTTLNIPTIILFESILSFLGLGVQPPMSSWGLLISDGVKEMEEAWWLVVFPGVILALTLFSLNFLGDGLRDALDPKASKD